MVKINLEYNLDFVQIFTKNNPHLIISEISAITGKSIIAGETLLFIDEIQVSPQAILSLRYFYEEMPELHVIAAGSLLDHTLNDIQYSVPVGRLEFVYMYPLIFYEFLSVLKQQNLYNYIKNYKIGQDFSEVIHKKFLEFLRLYFFIGGMPEAVQTYIDTKDILQVQKVHSNIITSLQFDFSKYGTRRQQEIMRILLNYVANNIGHKVKYVNIDRNSSSTQIRESILKLEMSRIISLARRTRSTNPPITQYVDNNIFKSCFFDIGLVNFLIGLKFTDINVLSGDYQGFMAEQFVVQELIANGQIYEDKKLYYWLRESKNSNAEIDLLYQKDNEIFPIEIKAEKSGSLKSLHVFMAEKNKNTGIRFNLSLPEVKGNLQTSLTIKNFNTLSKK